MIDFKRPISPAYLRTELLHLWVALRGFLAEEFALQKGRFILWSPVCLGVGIATYFILAHEPPVFLSIFSGLLSLSLLVLSWRHEFFRRLALACLVAVIGFGAAQMRTHMVQTPMLAKALGPVDVVGTIEAVEDMGDEEGSRILLSHLQVERLAPGETPKQVRLRVRKDEGLKVGQRIEALARLMPPSAPVMPGGFDFQRYMYFQGIGAVGFIYTQPEILEGQDQGGSKTEKIRQDIGQKIEQALTYPESAVGMALMIGRRAAMEEGDQQALRDAGLAHMLAISGLHIGLFSAAIFLVARFLMVLVPGFALRHPVKKYAAVFGILGAVIYTLLAGAAIPSQRALLMTSVVFVAIILDRSPISLRLVAIAALAVLFFSPESLLSASFHLSFAAVTALILFFDWLRPYWQIWYRGAGPLRRFTLYFVGICLTTLIASTATMPFSLFHFQRVALYDLLANLLAVPVLGFWIMPAALMSFVAMPFGIEVFPMWLMGQGIAVILEIAHWVTNLPHAVLRVPMMPVSVLVLFVCGLVFAALWRGRLRILGLLPIALSLMLASSYVVPDILVSSKSDLTLLHTPAGQLYVSTGRKAKFERKQWERAFGAEEGAAQIWPREGRAGPLSCGVEACRTHVEGERISFIRHPQATAEECAWADILISPDPVYAGICKARDVEVIDRFSTWKDGAHAIWVGSEKGIEMEFSKDQGRARPWETK